MYFKSKWILGKVSRVKNLDRREENLYQLLDAVAFRYGCLPSQLIYKGDTLDLEVYLTAGNLYEREEKLRKGENITDTYDQEYLKELYSNVKSKGLKGKSTKVQKEH